MTLKEKFNSIDQSRITADQKSFLDKMKNVTKDFTLENKEVNDKVEGALDKMITSFKEKMPDAIKTTKKVVAPKNAKEKKTVVKTSGGKRTIMSVAKDIRKEGESWKDAQKRASDMIKKDKSDVSKVVETELQKLSKFIKGRKELEGLSGTDLKRDSHRTALPKGRRLSKEGNVYYENRDNRTDRLAPNYPKDAPLLELGGGIRKKNGQTYDFGSVWTNDHNQFDKDAEHEVNYRKRKRFELGGTVVTDLAGHTSGGDAGLNANMPLSGFSNTAYTGLVGETGAMSSGEMFELGGGLPSGSEQHYVNYYLGSVTAQWIFEHGGGMHDYKKMEDNYANGGFMNDVYAGGGPIPNNYQGRSAKDVWNNLSISQRHHFLHDHNKSEIQSTPMSIEDFTKKSYNFLPTKVKKSFENHVKTGQYATGGMLNANERYVLEIKGLTGLRKEAIESYISENNLSDNDVLNIVIGLGRKQLKGTDVASAVVGKKGNSLSKEIIQFAKDNKGMKLEEGGNIDAFTLRMVKGNAGNPDEVMTESRSVQFVKGGAINGNLNKKVYELASKKKFLISDWATSEYNLIMGQALVESLTSANFHEEAKQVVAKLENKKWSKELYESEYFNPNKEVTEFADEVARICDYDGEDILNAYYFLTKMQGSKVSIVINDFLVIKKPSNAKYYILHADIKSVKVYKGSKVVTYSGKDVLNGANILKNGGGIQQKAYYIPKREVVEVELKNGETVKPANGYWIKKDAKQSFETGGDLGIEEEIDLTDDNRLRVKELTYEYKKPTAKELAEKHNSGAYEFMEEDKMMSGGKTKKGNGEAMQLAKKIRKDGEKWTDAVKRAWSQLK